MPTWSRRRASLSTHRAGLPDLFAQPASEDRYAASGEGADAIWLAERGWSVTGIDFSTVALERAAKHAATVGVGGHIEWRALDVRTFDPGPEDSAKRWDLVTSQVMHLPDGEMVDLTRRLGAAIAPDGTLIVVGHHPDDLMTGLRHGRRKFLVTQEDLMPALDLEGWTVEVVGARNRMMAWPDGKQVS